MSALENLSIILVNPRIPENIGAAVRTACNFGISSIILVRSEVPEWEKMAKTATHNAAHLLDSMPRFTTLDEALTQFQLVVGTTARRGRKRFAERSPKQMVEWLAPRLTNNKTAILFGPEDSGLTNEDLKFCQMVSAIPTDNFSSLNLAQAVAIHTYELYQNIIHTPKNLTPKKPTLASNFELESMYNYLEEALFRIDFLDEDHRPRRMANVRNFLGRMELEARDANLIRGVCKKFVQSKDSA